MNSVKVLLVSVTILNNFNMISSSDQYWEANLPITERIKKYGYPVENHTIITEDNYILTTYRIPHGINSNTTNKYPIILWHGMGASADIFLLIGNNSIPYYLANRGYDVWLANARGTFQSRKHLTLNPDDDKEYWDFSFHEIAVYDVAANIDYTLKETNNTSLFYIGHSQGATLMFVLLAERPDYNNKTKLSILMGPSGEFQFKQPPIMVYAASLHRGFERLCKKWKIHEVTPNIRELSTALVEFCGRNAGMLDMCYEIMYAIPGLQTVLFDRTLIPLALSTEPAGISIKNFIHYLQGYNSGYFRQYDYGLDGNLKKYNNTHPPLYNFKNIKAPIAIFHSVPDFFTPPEAIANLAKKLSNVAMVYNVPNKIFNHVDYVAAHNADELVYKPLCNLLEKYKSKNTTVSRNIK